MTKKRKKWPNLGEKLDRPWCYYCERDFDDLKILISHQKAKHFKCDRCGRRLNTAGGLAVHMNQVHKETLSQVENAIASRQALDIEIFGMEGVPQDIIDQHNTEVTRKHFEEEHERSMITGNPIRGQYNNGTAPPTKRLRVKETVEELEERAAKWREDKRNGIVPAPVVAESTPKAAAATPQQYGAPPGQSFPPSAPVFPPGQGHPAPNGSGFAPFPGGPSPVNTGIPPHQGSIPGQILPDRPPFGGPPPGSFPPAHNGPPGDLSASVDELISREAAASTPTAQAAPDRKTKKDKNIKLIYDADSVSPDEKLKSTPRFAALVRA